MLICGLGNPGKEYARTRHNVGWMFVDQIAKDHNAEFRVEERLGCFMTSFTENGQKQYLIKPVTFMNNSGFSVRAVANYFKIPVEEILIISDDRDLDVARIRIRKKGSSGGHNGLKSIIEQLGTSDFARIKIGIGRNSQDAKDYVLGQFNEEELALINSVLDKASNIVTDCIQYGIDYIMNKYNIR
jgi:PTH1 family peptidyl-tRNA hydrolase